MAFAFSVGDIRAWSSYSGDRNPIHFDPTESRKLGAPDLIVHGMLPILRARETLDERVARDCPDLDWVTSHLRLKHPVTVDEALELTTASTERGVRFKVSGATQPKIVGSVAWDAPAHTPQRRRPAVLADGTEPLEIRKDLLVLSEAFPWLTARWVAADATLFAKFIGQRVEPLRRAANSFLAANGIAEERLGGSTVVQSAHCTGYDSSFWRSPESLERALRSRFFEPELALIHAGCGSTLRWDIYCGDACVLSTTVDLLMFVNKSETRGE